MTTGIEVKHDRASDVLYARRGGVRIARSKEAPEDGYLILNMGPDGNVVGVQLLCAADMPTSAWLEHPDRSVLPSDLLSALDDWMRFTR